MIMNLIDFGMDIQAAISVYAAAKSFLVEPLTMSWQVQ